MHDTVPYIVDSVCPTSNCSVKSEKPRPCTPFLLSPVGSQDRCTPLVTARCPVKLFDKLSDNQSIDQ